MLTLPYTNQKPQYGSSLLDPDHPLSHGLVYGNLFNEQAGKKVFNIKTGIPYSLDPAYPPVWRREGLEFKSNRVHVDGPLLNSILPAGTEGTILIDYKKIGSVSSNPYFITVADSNYSKFHWGCNPTINIVYMSFSGLSTGVTDNNFLSGRYLCVRWTVNSGVTTFSVFRDGIFRGSNTANAVVPGGSYPLIFGGRTDADSRYADGLFRLIYIWDRALTDAQVSKISNNPYQILLNNSERIIQSAWSLSDDYIDLSLNCQSESNNIFTFDRIREQFLQCLSNAEVCMLLSIKDQLKPITLTGDITEYNRITGEITKLNLISGDTLKLNQVSGEACKL